VTSRGELRHTLRRRRRAVTPAERRRCAQRLARLATANAVFSRSRNIAIYLSNDGELDPAPLAERLRHMGKALFLPALRGSRLWFLPYEARTPMTMNRFGIPEPRLSPRRRCPTRALDVVLVPLVAFDEAGNRLGMGAGYYDQTFASHRYSCWRRPTLIGVGYDFQRVADLPHQSWDVPLRGVATESGLTFFSRGGGI